MLELYYTIYMTTQSVSNVHPDYNAAIERLDLHDHNHNIFSCFYGNKVCPTRIFDFDYSASVGLVLFLNVVNHSNGYDSSFPLAVIPENQGVLRSLDLTSPYITCYEIPLKQDGSPLMHRAIDHENMVYKQYSK